MGEPEEKVVDEKGDRARARLKEKRFRHNWRIDMLAVPKGHTEEVEMFKMSPQEKDVFLKEKASKVSVKKSEPKIEDEKKVTRRLNELASFPPRFYSVQKKIFKESLGKKFEQRMDKRGKVSYNSQYYEYKRAKKAYK